MEIVIKIPKEIYTGEQKAGILPILVDAIGKGIPLPEDRGRLIDADALEEYFRNVRKELKASDYKNAIEFFVRDEMLLNFQQFIHLCDAIIEGSDIDGR